MRQLTNKSAAQSLLGEFSVRWIFLFYKFFSFCGDIANTHHCLRDSIEIYILRVSQLTLGNIWQKRLLSLLEKLYYIA